ncbi:GSCOCG00012684001-RA-CDS, partial [Cotesia congregata]
LGTRRAPSQQSFHSSKNNQSHHSSGASINVGGQPVQLPTLPNLPVTQTPPVASTSMMRSTYQLPEFTPAKCIHIRSSSKNLATTRNQQSITKMLLLISTVFVLLNLPR